MTINVRLAPVRFGVFDDVRCKNIIPAIHIVFFKVAELFNAELVFNDTCMQDETVGWCGTRW